MVPQALLMQISTLPSNGSSPPTSLSAPSLQSPARVARSECVSKQITHLNSENQHNIHLTATRIFDESAHKDLKIVFLKKKYRPWQTTPASSLSVVHVLPVLCMQFSRDCSVPEQLILVMTIGRVPSPNNWLPTAMAPGLVRQESV